VSEADRYTRRSILRSEQMYGRGFQSPGQLETVEAACAMLDLRAGMRVLDLGSGLGGPAMHLARAHGLSVVGVDLAPAMVELSRERLRESGLAGVEFLEGDVRSLPLADESFDLAWTRDAIIYVADKDSIWRRLRALLRPRGRLYVADFCRAPGVRPADFEAYVEQCGYHLLTIEDYAAALGAAGFADVRALDQTALFEGALERELRRFEEGASSFLAEFTREDYDHLVGRWRTKIDFCRRGDLLWGWFLTRV
jgi:phosphoethanolamine N-methyltransferase